MAKGEEVGDVVLVARNLGDRTAENLKTTAMAVRAAGSRMAVVVRGNMAASRRLR